MKNRLFLSKPGIMCAAGTNAEELWESAIQGRQDGIVQVKTFSDNSFFAGKIKDSSLSSANCKYDMRVIQIADAALNQISEYVKKAKQKFGSDRIAVCVGSCDNGSEFSVKGHRKYFADGNFPDDYSLEIQGADYPATFIKEKFGITGPGFVLSTACSSSGSAMIKAAELINAGIADAVITGGLDVASDTVLLGFNSLESIANGITNPFSKNRNGITLGEAAAFFVLAKDKDTVLAKSNSGNANCAGGSNIDCGADIDCGSESQGCAVELLGTGESSDAYHMTSPAPDGISGANAVNAALRNAGIRPDSVDYLNLHGTGTRLNDSMEAKAVALSFPETYTKMPSSSTKPLTGHTLGAAAALELAICYMAICKNDKKSEALLPVHVYDGQYDSEIPQLHLVKKGEAFNKVNICMSNSFGFGGCNTSLIIGKSNG